MQGSIKRILVLVSTVFSFAAAYTQAPFITTWASTDIDQTITIPTTGTGYDYDISWKVQGNLTDEGSAINITGDYSITFLGDGIYEVSISGDFPRIYFNQNHEDRLQLLSVEQWGDIAWTSMAGSFWGCSNLVINAEDNPDLSGVSSMAHMFRENANFNHDISDWDVRGVASMSNMFRLASNFNQNISGWVVSNVTDMRQMFNGATNFNQDISSWNMESVNNVTGMLNNSGINRPNYDKILQGWASQNLNTGLSLGASNLQFCDGETARQNLIDTHGWTITDGEQNCNDAVTIEAIPVKLVGDEDFTVSTTAESGLPVMLFSSDPSVATISAGNIIHIESAGNAIITASNVSDGNYSEAEAVAYLLVLETLDDQRPFVTTWQSNASGDAITIPTNSVNYSYNYDVSWKKIGEGDIEDSASGITANHTITFMDEVTYEVSITGDFPHLYFNNAANSDKLLTVSQWGDILWKDMNHAFYGCSNMNVTAQDSPILLGVSSMSGMFIDAVNFDANIGNWDTRNITHMFRLFEGAKSFNQYIADWDVSKVLNTGSMFKGATIFNQSIGSWDVSSVLFMDEMFNGATSFNQNIGGWNVGNVCSMISMFDGAHSFNQNISEWNVSKSSRMDNMFRFAVNFDQNISGWNVSAVTDMSGMFRSAFGFNQDIGSWNLGAVTDMAEMLNFSGISNVTYDKILHAWANQPSLPTNLRLGAQRLGYCASGAARNILLSEKNWTIDGDAMDCSQTITFNSIPIKHAGDPDFEVIATSSFGLPVTLSTSDESIATISGSTVHIVSPGSVKVIASQPGDGGSIPAAEDAFIFIHVLPSDVDQQPFVTTWQSDRPGDGIIIPTTDGSIFSGNYHYDVSWKKVGSSSNEGTIQGKSENVYLTFEEEGVYEVAITGAYPSFYIFGSGFASKLLTVEQWGDIFWESMAYSFYGCEQVTLQASDSPDLRLVKDMESMFFQAKSFNQYIGNWNVSNVENMSGMFLNASSFNQDISSWDMSSVTDVSSMLDKTGITTVNYDRILTGWSTQTLTDGLILGADGLTYCSAADAIAVIPWTINDDGIDCAQTITFENLEDASYSMGTLELSATASSNLPITYSVPVDNTVATISGSTLSIIGVGATQITASQPGDEHYNSADDEATITVNQAPLTVRADDTSRKYGASNPVLGISYEGFAPGESESDLTTTAAAITTATPTSETGVYPIDVSGGSSPNYTFISYESGTLTVEKTPLTVTANDQTILQGESVPELALSYAGFVNDETPSVLDEVPAVSTLITNTATPGSYAITVSGGKDNNYSFSLENGTLIIEKILGLTDADIIFYPNPTQGDIHIESQNVSQIEISDLNGKLLRKLNNTETIDVSSLKPGTYLLVLKNAEGKTLETYRMIRNE
ncbi:MAG: BspA family leucine-rich repeat surface protein [Ekhidna sp.]